MTTASHYALVDCGRDALLLDLRSGNLFQLNGSAAWIWARFLEGATAPALAEMLASRHGLSSDAAREHVALALAPDPGASEGEGPDGPYLYQRLQDGYLLSRDGVPLLSIDADGARVRLAREGSIAPRDLPLVLQAIAPKLMALRGHFVLHASAVVLDQTIVAFSGKSGAGKTTTARALAKAGARLVTEDKLVLRTTGGRVGAPIDCERRIIEWVHVAAADLSAARAAPFDALDVAATGESTPIGAIGFLATQRRSGASFTASPLDRAQSTRALFGHSFHGSDLPEDWRRHLMTAAEYARHLAAFEITAPDGLAALAPAARDLLSRGGLAQTAMTAS